MLQVFLESENKSLSLEKSKEGILYISTLNRKRWLQVKSPFNALPTNTTKLWPKYEVISFKNIIKYSWILNTVTVKAANTLK